MFQNLSGWHALVILTIVLLVFGSAKLPMLARSVGQSVKILKDEVHDGAGSGEKTLSIATGSRGAATSTAEATADAAEVATVADRRAS
jgi:sec-independent protein translocase protein TatA